MKRTICLLLVLLVSLGLCGCCLSHDWQEATCAEPKTCSKCGKTEGEPLGHVWIDATCTEPKICSVCGETDGNPLGHKADKATCTNDSVCSVCGKTVQKALGHDWQEATCTEPKTCSKCGKTEGEPLGHVWIDATCTEPKICSVCGETDGNPLDHEWIDACYASPKLCILCGKTEGSCIDITPRQFMELFNSKYAGQGMRFSKLKDWTGENWYVSITGLSDPLQIQFLEPRVVASTGTGDIDMKRSEWASLKINAMTYEPFDEDIFSSVKQLAVNVGTLLGDEVDISNFASDKSIIEYESPVIKYKIEFYSPRGMYDLTISFKYLQFFHS